jgi:hypothetical protein|tara:strand:- start:287 stop:511 length:225 start_codon:yes stop_codon:yes gene_type:complete
MEYIAGPVITLLLAMKFTDWKSKQLEERIASAHQQVELVRKDIEVRDAELPKKVMTTVIPLAKAVKNLNQQVGL